MEKIILIVIFSLLTLIRVVAEEITLFDKKGEPIAYIDEKDDFTIYLWDGTPVAYLLQKGKSSNLKKDNFSVYGFNGKHLGWLVEGIIRDLEGNATGFI